MKSRSTRSETTITILMAVVLPAMTVAVALILGARAPLVVLAAGTGGLLGAYWTGRILTLRVKEMVDLRLHNERTHSDLTALRTELAFRERFEDALRESSGESTTIELTLRAVSEIIPDAQISFLLSQPDHLHLGWAVTLHGGRLDPAVPIHNSPRCRALERGGTVTSRSNHEVGSCEHMAGQSVEVSSLCAPLVLGDRTLGVVNAICPPGQPPGNDAITGVEWVLERAAIRMTEQRLERGPSSIGAPDPVTGLPGAEAFRSQLKDLIRALVRFSVAMIRIDDFEGIIHVEGPESSDLMLATVAHVLTSTVRPDDFVCRYDSSTFAVVLPGCDAARAAGVLERARESLALLLVMEGELAFTCSAGVAESNQATSIDELTEMAEATCARAAASGGNRVLVTFGTDHM